MKFVVDLENIKTKLEPMTLRKVSAETGLSLPTIYDLSKGLRTDYSLKTISIITEYLEKPSEQ